MNPEEFMREAIALSKENISTTMGGPFGAVVVKDGKIIGRGVNNVTTCNDPTAHAEIVAIRQACEEMEDFSLAGCEIYSSCEPCPMCLSAIYWARIDKLYFANGRLRSVKNYSRGERNGLAVEYYPNGELFHVEYFSNLRHVMPQLS